MSLVIAGLIIGIAVMNAVQKKAAEKEPEALPPTHETVFDKGKAIVTAIHFKDKDTEMSFSYINDEWVYDADPNFPLYKDRVAAMAASVSKIDAAATISDNKKPLSDFGLDENASVTVFVTYSDGNKKTFLFGNKNSFNSCQYLSISGDKNIYMIEENVAEPFAADLDYLYDPETFVLQKDGVDYTSIKEITVTTAKGEANTISDVEGIYNLTELIMKLDLSTYEDYYADKTEMAESYLISPEGDRISIKYSADGAEEKEYVIYIGAKNEPKPEESPSTEDGETTAPESDTTAPETDTTAPESDTAAPESDSPEGDEEKESTYCYFYTFNESTVVYNGDGETVDKIFTYLTYTPKTEEEKGVTDNYDNR